MKFIGKEGMSIYDVAFMCYGTYDILKLMNENSFITDVNYSDFAGKTINYTSEKNNISYALGLENRIANTAIKTINIIWDGVYDIWDGTYDLAY